MQWDVKSILAAIALVVASTIAIWAMLLPPQGEVSQSVLIEIAQFLVFAATLLGVDSAVEKFKRFPHPQSSPYNTRCTGCMLPLGMGAVCLIAPADGVLHQEGFFFVAYEGAGRAVVVCFDCDCDGSRAAVPVNVALADGAVSTYVAHLRALRGCAGAAADDDVATTTVI